MHICAGCFKPALLCDAWLKHGLLPADETETGNWNTGEPGSPYFEFSNECKPDARSLEFPAGASASMMRDVPFYLSTRDGLTFVLRFKVLEQPDGALSAETSGV